MYLLRLRRKGLKTTHTEERRTHTNSWNCIISLRYRVSHETWQLVNSFECLLPYTVLDIKDFLQFISLKNLLLKNLLLWNQSKLFTNCNVSWYTLYHPFSKRFFNDTYFGQGTLYFYILAKILYISNHHHPDSCRRIVQALDEEVPDVGH